jgi:adenine phosphoribosyltransferase
MESHYDLDSAIRKIPDFPKPGILFYDITGILVNPEAFRFSIDRICEIAESLSIEAVAGIDARGFVFASPVAYRLNLPLVLVRKRGKLPGDKLIRRFTLEYGQDEIEIHKADLSPARRILLIDDLVATGGTLKAAAEIIEEAGSSVASIVCVVGLPFLEYEAALKPFKVKTLIQYHGE